MNKTFPRLICAGSIAAFLLGSLTCPPEAKAVVLHWTGTTSNTWATFNNWSINPAVNTNPAFVVPGAADVATFNWTGGIPANQIATIGVGRNAGELVFGANSTTAINLGASGLTLTLAGVNDATVGAITGIRVDSGAAAHTISANLALSATQVWKNSSPTNNFTIGGSFTPGAANLTLNSASTRGFVFGGAVTLGNTTTWTNDSLTGGFTIGPVTTTLNAGVNWTLAGAGAISVGGTFVARAGSNDTVTISGTGARSFNNIDLSDTAANNFLTMSIPGGSAVTVLGPVANGGTSTASGLTKNGVGSLTLTGLNSFAGLLAINDGAVILTNSNTAAFPVTLGQSASPATLTPRLTVDQPTLVGTITFQNGGGASPGGVIDTTSTGTLRLVGTTTISVADTSVAPNAGRDDLAINVPIVNDAGTARAATKTGLGNLVFNGANSFTGTLTISSGQVIVRTSNSNAGGLTMTPNATTPTKLLLENGADFRMFGTLTTNTTAAASGLEIANGLTAGGRVLLNPGATAVSRTFNVLDNTAAANDLIITVPIADGGTGPSSISKEGAGQLVFRADNTFAGPLSFYRGTTVVDYGFSQAGKLSDLGDLQPRGGVLTLSSSTIGPVAEVVGNLSPGGSNLGPLTVNPSPAGAEPASHGNLNGTASPSGGASLINLVSNNNQDISLTFSGFLRNPGGGIVTLAVNDPAHAQFRTTQVNNSAGLLAVNAILGGRWIANDGSGRIVQAVGVTNSDQSQWQSTQHIQVATQPTGVLTTNRIGALSFTGGDATLTINNSTRSLTLTTAGVLLASGASASVVEIAGGKLMTELPYRSAAGADILLQNFATGLLKVSSNLGHSDAPLGNTLFITIAGTGVVELAGKSTSLPTYNGNTILRGAVKVIGGATLRVSGGDAISDYLPLDLGTNGDVAGNFQLNGASEAIGGILSVNTNQGNNGGSISLGTGGALTLNQTISAETFSGTITGTSASLIKQGNQTTTLASATATNPFAFTGSVQVLGGLLDLTGANPGITGVTSILLRDGEIRSEQNQASIVNKLGDSATVRLEGTRNDGLRVTSNQNGRSESVLALEVNASANSVTVNANNATTPLTLSFTKSTAGLVRSNAATMLVRGDDLGGGAGGTATNTARILFTSGVTGLVGGGTTSGSTISILPWAIGSTADPVAAVVGDSFVTYGTNGLRPLAPSEYTTGYPPAPATSNFTTNTTQTGLATATLNSLRMDTSAGPVSMTGVGGGTNILTISSGAILVSAGATTNNATIDGYFRLDPGAQSEYVIHVTSSSATAADTVLTIAPFITESGAGNVSVTKSGTGTLELTGTGNNFQGGLTVNQGVLQFGNINNIGSSTGLVRLAGGTLKWTGATTVDVSAHPIELRGPVSYYTPAGTGAAGNALNRGSTIDTGIQTVTIAGPSGSGGLVKIGTGTLTVSTAPTYTGGTVHMQGLLELPSLTTSSGLYIMPENFNGQENIGVQVNVTNALSVQQLIVGGVFTTTSTLNSAGTLVVGTPSIHPAVTIGNGGGDSYILVGYRDELAATATAGTVVSGIADFTKAGSVDINVSRIFLGQNKGGATGTFRTDGDMRLASTGTNNVTAGVVLVGNSPGPDSTGAGGTISTLFLGGGLNNFKVDSMVIGGQNSNGKVDLATGGTFVLRDRSGLGGANVFIGDNDDNTGTIQDFNNTTLDTTGGSIDAKINLLVIGRHGAGTGGGEGALRFKAGTIEATTVQMGVISNRGNSTNPAQTVSEITQGGGTFRFGTLSRGGAAGVSARYNWDEGTIEPIAGMNAFNQNVFITTKPGINGLPHFLNVPFGATMTFGSGAGFDGTDDVTKTGQGTLILQGASTHGATFVNEGTLLANNTSASATGSGFVRVEGGAELGGSGRITGTTIIKNGGKLTVGAIAGSIGAFQLADLDIQEGGILELEIKTNGAAPFSDELTLNGSMNLDPDIDPMTNPILSLTKLSGATLAEGVTIPLINYFGGWDGGLFKVNGEVIDDYDDFSNPMSATFAIAGDFFRLDYDAGGGFRVDLISVPEPGALASLIGGLGMLLGLQRFRRRAEGR
ncbi:MAG: autotransporter-associated beta strand repeat-containing protein [Chthoniobacteraceae bacterium]